MLYCHFTTLADASVGVVKYIMAAYQHSMVSSDRLPTRSRCCGCCGSFPLDALGTLDALDALTQMLLILFDRINDRLPIVQDMEEFYASGFDE